MVNNNFVVSSGLNLNASGFCNQCVDGLQQVRHAYGSWKLETKSRIDIAFKNWQWAVLRGTRQHVAKSAQLDLSTEVFMMFVTISKK